MLFFQNPPNALLAERELKVSTEYTRGQWAALVLIWILVLPLALPLWLLATCALGVFSLSGTITFWITQRLFAGKQSKAPAFKWQWVRAYINNCIATKLPHWNAPFRRFLFRLSGIRIGRNGFIGMNGIMEDYHPENVVIEDNVTISFGVTFIAHGAKQNKTNAEKHIIIRENAYVGAASVLLPGIEIGRMAVIGAGAVVTKDVPAGAIVAGSPARILRYKQGFEPDCSRTPSGTES